MTKKCLNPKCNKEFTPKNKKGVYCSGNCRAAHAYQLKNKKETKEKVIVFEETENGTWKLSDGTKGDFKWSDGEKINVFPANEKQREISDYAKPKADKKETPVVSINPNEKRIAELRNELKNPPKNPQIGLRKWIAVRENEIKNLEMNT